MRKLRRAFLAPLLATVALLVGAPAAPAQFGEDQEFVTFQQAELVTPFVVQVSGTLTCPSDAGSSSVSVQLLQRGGRGGFSSGSGWTYVQCTGNPETFVVEVVGPFHPGRATLIGHASYCSFSPPYDYSCFEDRDVREIPIRR